MRGTRRMIHKSEEMESGKSLFSPGDRFGDCTVVRLLGGGAKSVEILPVWAHEKRGRAVGSHLHLNVSYLFEAEDSGALRAAPEENTGAAWLPVDKLSAFVTEEQMLPIYNKLIQRANIVRIHP